MCQTGADTCPCPQCMAVICNLAESKEYMAALPSQQSMGPAYPHSYMTGTTPFCGILYQGLMPCTHSRPMQTGRMPVVGKLYRHLSLRMPTLHVAVEQECKGFQPLLERKHVPASQPC